MDPNVAQLVQAQSVAVDLEQLADVLGTLIADDARRAAMGAAGRARVREQFRASAIVARYEALWDGLAAVARTTPWPAPPAGTAPLPPASWTPPPAQIFGAYPTRFLTPDDRLVAVPGVAIDPPYSDVAPLLERTRLEALCARAAAPAAARDLVAVHPIPARGWFMLLWLLKYGVLRLAPAELPPQPSARPPGPG
jgi:hypothetical protein